MSKIKHKFQSRTYMYVYNNLSSYTSLHSPRHRFGDYIPQEEVETAEPKLILKRNPREAPTIEKVLLIMSTSMLFRFINTCTRGAVHTEHYEQQ